MACRPQARGRVAEVCTMARRQRRAGAGGRIDANRLRSAGFAGLGGAVRFSAFQPLTRRRVLRVRAAPATAARAPLNSPELMRCIQSCIFWESWALAGSDPNNQLRTAPAAIADFKPRVVTKPLRIAMQFNRLTKAAQPRHSRVIHVFRLLPLRHDLLQRQPNLVANFVRTEGVAGTWRWWALPDRRGHRPRTYLSAALLPVTACAMGS